MRVGQTRRRDTAEKAIVEGLERLGAQVTRISGVGAPDVIARYRGVIYAWEIKSGKGKRTPAQEETEWPIVRSLEDALALMGVTT